MKLSRELIAHDRRDFIDILTFSDTIVPAGESREKAKQIWKYTNNIESMLADSYIQHYIEPLKVSMQINEDPNVQFSLFNSKKATHQRLQAIVKREEQLQENIAILQDFMDKQEQILKNNNLSYQGIYFQLQKERRAVEAQLVAVEEHILTHNSAKMLSLL